MRKTLFTPLYLSVLLLATSACDLFNEAVEGIGQFTQFEMEYNTSVTIPSSAGINLPFNVQTPPVETNTESEMSVNNTHKDLLEEVTLRSLILTVDQPSNGDFSFLESIEVYITAEGLSEARIAYANDVPANQGATLELETTEQDLKDYIKAENFSLRIHTVTDEAILSDHEIGVATVFFVDAEILGQ